MPFFKKLITIINIPRLLLHLVAFSLYKDRIRQDVIVNLEHTKYEWGGVTFGFLYLLVFDKPFRNLFYWRIGKLKYLMWYWLWPHPCFTIATKMEVAPGFMCVHPFGTIVNAESIGKNFTVRNNVTIGNNKSGDRPTIGDNVSINANSVVIGRINIGNNVVIGAGSVVTKNVPDNCVVVGNPAFILKEKGTIVKRPL